MASLEDDLPADLSTAPASNGAGRDQADGVCGRCFLQGAVAFGVILWSGTELLGAFGPIRAAPLTAWWTAAAVIALTAGARSLTLAAHPALKPSIRPF
jgi:hypothetical protein